MQTKKRDEYRVTWTVAIALTVLTVVEFYLAAMLHISNPAVMFLLGIMKAALVVYYFMHISRLWSSEGEH